MPTDPTDWKRRGTGVKLALVGAGIASGAVIATAVGANAATSGSGSSAAPTQGGTPPTSQPSGQPPMQPGAGRPFDHGGSAPVRDDEKAVGSALSARLKAAALKAVPGGTVYRIESDSGDGTYEAHMAKANGSLVTVKFDKAGTVTSVEQGMGK